jgi:hypothetical protein
MDLRVQPRPGFTPGEKSKLSEIGHPETPPTDSPPPERISLRVSEKRAARQLGLGVPAFTHFPNPPLVHTFLTHLIHLWFTPYGGTTGG